MMTDILKNENERLDDLQCKGFQLIQNTACFCFGMDAVLLSSFAQAGKDEQVVDFCTGNGVIPVLMCAKYPKAQYHALEIQEISYDLAQRNVILNGLQDQLKVVQGDVKEAISIFGRDRFQVVTCNPPYMNQNHGLRNPDSAKAIARHEILCTLEDVVAAASGVLCSKGRFYMVHRPQRLVEIFSVLKRYHLEPKRMRMIHSYEDSEATMVLIEAVKGANAQLIVEPPLVVYQKDGNYTEELYRCYHTENNKTGGSYV